MSQANPLISVIMATYNREYFIRAAVESVLAQPYTPMEIVIVDDGSTDKTPELIRDLASATVTPIRYAYQSNRGQPVALNHGLQLVQGEIIAFIDSDDLWPADRLPGQMAYFVPETPSEVGPPGIVLGREQRFADGASVNPEELAAANARPVHYSLGASLFERWVFATVGQFDESLRYTADWDWFVRAREIGIPMAADPRVTLLLRIHGGNITQDRSTGNHFMAQMVKKHMTRIRKESGGSEI